MPVAPTATSIAGGTLDEMAYAIEASETVTMAVRRIATEEIEAALDDLRGATDLAAPAAIHDCRRRCKKMRGLLRLIGPSLGRRYARADARVRDAARELSGARDAHALADAFERATATSPVSSATPVDRVDGFAPVAAGLQRRAAAASLEFDALPDHVMRASALLEKVHGGIDDWRLSADGWEAIGIGLADNYLRGRRALRSTRLDPTAERFHDWRKRAKYLWYHVRLLERAGPNVLAPLSAALSDLADNLGDAHDLAVLDDVLTANTDEFGGTALVAHARCVIGERRRLLETQALANGARLYVEAPSRFAERIEGYWDLWQGEHG
ncbi:MAG: CHAD domain-containing protein [Actinomycetota bacterium]